MPQLNVCGIDRRILFGSALSVTTGIALYSTYKLWLLRDREKLESVYETKKALNEYLIFHYGKADEILKYELDLKSSLDFPKRCAELCLKYFKPGDEVPSRAFDIGCAVGRSSFELAREFQEVIGLDYSHSFVNACNNLKDKGKMSYNVQTEGDLVLNLEAKLDTSVDARRCTFQQGDACNLPQDLGQFGCILAANLICRLPSPDSFLDRLPMLVASGGILVITSPYTFLEEFTPKDKWIGAYFQNGTALSAFDGLRQKLEKHFDLIAEENMPFLIRETARKNQLTVAHATVWKRKS